MKSFFACVILLGIAACVVGMTAPAQSSQPWRAGLRSDCKAKEGMTLHWHYVNELKHKHPKVLFIGDSIIAYWAVAGKDSWTKYFLPMDSMDIGIGGEITQSILWRLDHQAIDGANPDEVVLMIGSNNLIVEEPKDVAHGVQAIVEVLEKKLPHAKILLLGILPRDPGKLKIPLRKRVDETNKILSSMNSERVTYLNLNERMLNPDGSIAKSFLPDGIHPSAAGYEALAPELAAKLKLMQTSEAHR